MKRLSFLVAISLYLGCRAPSGPDVTPEASAHPTTFSPSNASEALDNLDRRRPVPLLPMMAQHQKQNMREHLEAVQEIVAAVAAGDFDGAGVSAKRMGYSETMGRMCEHMGAGAPGFSEQAVAFHHTADEIVAAAAKQDGPAVLAALSKTLRACTTCHATYKQRLVPTLPE
jgi:hypothetical protein